MNPQRAPAHAKFADLDTLRRIVGSDTIPADIYDEVFNGELPETDPEAIFARFNQDTPGHPLHRGHSLSVSDIVVNENGIYYCDVLGFKEIKFDESAAHKPDNLMRVVYVEPHMPAYVTSIPAGLKGYQQAVSGYIEVLYNDDDTALICNEEAKLIGMEGNRHYGNGGVIAGPFFVIGLTEDDFRSLTNGEVRKYLDKYAEPEDISPAEVQADTGFQVIGFF